MAATSINLDSQCDAQTFPFGTTAASGQGLVTIYKGTAAATTVVLDVKGSATIGGDINLTGNLNITGAVNTQSVTNTNVADITITLNDGGTTPTDDTSGIIVEGTSNTVVGALYYKAASATKWSVGTGASQQDIVGTSATQTLTNKTISGGQISTAVATATALATPRAIYGNNFDGSAAITSIIASTYGGTGNGFAKLSGPTTSEKTFTLPNASATILTDNAAVTVAQGGTGIATTTAYGVLLGGTTATGAFQNAGAGTSGYVLTSNGAGVAPTWAAVSPATYTRFTAVSGTQDSSNKIFTIANALTANTEQVYINGILMMPGSSNDYVISGTTVTFQAARSAPRAVDVIRVYGNY